MPSCGSPRSRRSRTPIPPRGSAICRGCSPIRCARCASRPRARSRARPKRARGRRPARASNEALAEYVAAQTYNADRPEGRSSLAQSVRRARRRAGARSPSIARRSRSIRRSWPPTRISPICIARAAPKARPRRCCARASRKCPRGGAAPRARPRAGAPETDRRKPQGIRAGFARSPGQRPLRLCLRGGAQQRGPEQGGAARAGRRVEARTVRSRRSRPGSRLTPRAANRDAALGYVKQLRELDPENPSYAQMAKQIEGAR